VYDDANYWSLSITSGMEKFISSLAIRAALIKVTSLPKLSFLVIDEGLGNLDADHFNSMYLLFEYLKGQFDFIIVISHLDQARDLVENFLEITQRREYSHITHV
jgi:DNA repair exonuclease SbcCD ATPase subunit